MQMIANDIWLICSMEWRNCWDVKIYVADELIHFTHVEQQNNNAYHKHTLNCIFSTETHACIKPMLRESENCDSQHRLCSWQQHHAKLMTLKWTFVIRLTAQIGASVFEWKSTTRELLGLWNLNPTSRHQHPSSPKQTISSPPHSKPHPHAVVL